MIKVALRGMSTRRLRTALTALAIVLGVGMVAAAFTVGDTMRQAANSLSTSAYKGTDAVVSAPSAFKTDTVGGTDTIPTTTLDRVRSVPGVGVATGDILQEARLIDKGGKAIGDGPWFGMGYDASSPDNQKLNPMHLKSGRWATGPGEVVVDAGTARKNHFAVGDNIEVAAHGPRSTFRVVGVARFGDVESLGTATVAVFDLKTAQSMFAGHASSYDDVLVKAAPGTTANQLRVNLMQAFPKLDVRSAEAQDRFTFDGLKQFISIIKTVLLVFGFIAIFVGAFTIYNTLSITVAQRSRELATLRTVGASRRQVLGSVLLEALAVGAAGSAAGIGVGLALAHGLDVALDAVGLDLPQAAMGLALRTVVVSLIVGIGVTVIAGLGPALRATRVSPTVALREGAHVPTGRLGRCGPAIGAVLVALGLAVVGYGMFAGGLAAGERLLSLAPGTLALFLGGALLSPVLARPLASVLGRPGQRLGGAAGELARHNAMRNPKRTAITAAALMVGVALVAFVAVLGQGLKASSVGELERSLKAGHVITATDGFSPVDPAAAAAAAKVHGVTGVAALRQDQGRAFGQKATVDGIDPARWAKAWEYDVVRGGAGAVGALTAPGTALVRDDFARKHHLAVGDRFEVTPLTGRRLDLRVGGTVEVNDLDPVGLGQITVGARTFDRAFTARHDRFALVSGGSSPGLKAALRAFPDAKIQTAAGFTDQAAEEVTQLLGMIYVLLALAVLVSLFGIVNTLALAV